MKDVMHRNGLLNCIIMNVSNFTGWIETLEWSKLHEFLTSCLPSEHFILRKFQFGKIICCSLWGTVDFSITLQIVVTSEVVYLQVLQERSLHWHYWPIFRRSCHLQRREIRINQMIKWIIPPPLQRTRLNMKMMVTGEPYFSQIFFRCVVCS